MAECANAENSPGPSIVKQTMGHWSGDDVMTFGIKVGRIGR